MSFKIFFLDTAEDDGDTIARHASFSNERVAEPVLVGTLYMNCVVPVVALAKYIYCPSGFPAVVAPEACAKKVPLNVDSLLHTIETFIVLYLEKNLKFSSPTYIRVP